MARTKRGSTVLETARHRLAGLKSIKIEPVFGGGLSLDSYETEVTSFSAALDNYNQKLAELDDLQNQLQTAETSLREKNRRMLSAAEATYGPDSSEFEQAGGKRVSEHKRPAKKKTNKGSPTS